ncbi:MAG: hypothetical protein ACRD96_11765, partial [Bryobacteraceae bacterium]
MRNSGILFLAGLIGSGCGGGPERTPALAEAFAGPASLTLRKEIGPRSAVTASVTHGERLEVLQHRRRFVKVRTAQGAEGWTDERGLLGPREMARLRRLAAAARSMPSHGAATSFGPLNVHTEPARLSPSFVQVQEKENVDVLAHRTAPRDQPAPRRTLV